MKIAIVMIHFGDTELTASNLEKIKDKIAGSPLFLINNSPGDIRALGDIIPRTEIIDFRRNTGFSRAVNAGIKQALADSEISGVCLLNNDLFISFGSLERLVWVTQSRSDAGIVAPVLHHGAGLYDWGAKLDKFTGLIKHVNFPQKPKTLMTVDFAAGAAMLIKREVFEKIGYFDERFFLYYEDADFCLRARRAGFKIYIYPEIVAEHSVSAGSSLSRRIFAQWKSHIIFEVKHWPVYVYPTSFIVDIIYYPLLLIKVALGGFL